jgi:hypothetical protein
MLKGEGQEEDEEEGQEEDEEEGQEEDGEEEDDEDEESETENGSDKDDEPLPPSLPGRQQPSQPRHSTLVPHRHHGKSLARHRARRARYWLFRLILRKQHFLLRPRYPAQLLKPASHLLRSADGSLHHSQPPHQHPNLGRPPYGC